MTSRPAPALNADGTWITLGQLLSTLMPEVDFKADFEDSKHLGCDEDEAPPQIATQSLSNNASTPAAVPQIMLDPLMSRPPEATSGGTTDVDSQATGESEDSGHQNGAASSEQQPLAPVPSMITPLSSHGLQRGGVFQALVSGIVPPLQTPIAWLHAQMHAPDYFLYIVVMPVR